MPEIFGLSLEQFEQGYVDYLNELVAGMSSLARPTRADFEDLLQSHREQPDDAEVAAALAVAYLSRDAGDEALRLAQRVLKQHPKHQQATYVIARLRIADKKSEEAVALGDRIVRFERGRSVATGTAAELLPTAQPVRVRGRLERGVESLGDGLARATLREVSVEGPIRLLEGSDPELDLSLVSRRTPPRE